MVSMRLGINRHVLHDDFWLTNAASSVDAYGRFRLGHDATECQSHHHANPSHIVRPFN
jgi:hypothetical protein